MFDQSTIKSANAFVALMDTIWGDDPDGLYNRWHNANLVARACAAECVGIAQSDDGTPATIYEFADGTRVIIPQHGGGVEIPKA